jgi:hypothetical protein
MTDLALRQNVIYDSELEPSRDAANIAPLREFEARRPDQPLPTSAAPSSQ